jgi:hypothetical protein
VLGAKLKPWLRFDMWVDVVVSGAGVEVVFTTSGLPLSLGEYLSNRLAASIRIQKKKHDKDAICAYLQIGESC